MDSVRDCYAALGLVHGAYKSIPHEFDDYIASPKPNGYRSLHTAVIGPQGKVVEVQIRTQQMHDEAEYGVCAHYKYKGTDTEISGEAYEEKIAWLRQVLDWHDEWAIFENCPMRFGKTFSRIGFTYSLATGMWSTSRLDLLHLILLTKCTPKLAIHVVAQK